ncbi:unnamed protein product [Meganyctiphanes norvegica]|uniref:Uncharacterized protein n=1 Tax=Meganyctiphanes norvegica TaxID=48144 RepID=A0AAV2R9X4_MEGNR
MVQWFDKSSTSSGSYKNSVKSLAQSFVEPNPPERKQAQLRSSRRSCYDSVTAPESNTSNTIQRPNDHLSRRVTSPAYSQSTNSSDGCSEYGSYSNYSSRPSTPVMSYGTRNSQFNSPVRKNESDNRTICTRKYSNASCRTDKPIRFYDNPLSRSTTPMRSVCSPSSRPSTPLGSYYNSNNQSGTQTRSYNGYISRDSSPTPTHSSSTESTLDPVYNRSSSSRNRDFQLPNNQSSRSTTPMRSYCKPSSRPSTPLGSYYTSNSRSGTPTRSYNGYISRDNSPTRTKSNPIETNFDSIHNKRSSSRNQDIQLLNNPSSRSTTPMRSFCTPSSRPSTPLGSYYTSNSRSGTPMRSYNDYISRDSSPTPTISTANDSILEPIRNRISSSKNRDLPLPKSRADILVPLKYYFTDVPNTAYTSQRCRSSSRSRSSCNTDESSQANNVPLRCRSSSRSRSTCNGDTSQSRPRNLSLPRPKTVYSSAESSRNEIDFNTLPSLSSRRGSYIENGSRSSSITRDMHGSSESLQNLINLPPTKDIETRVKASMRSKLTLPSINSDNIRSRKARSQYLSGVINGNTYQDEDGSMFVLN